MKIKTDSMIIGAYYSKSFEFKRRNWLFLSCFWIRHFFYFKVSLC